MGEGSTAVARCGQRAHVLKRVTAAQWIGGGDALAPIHGNRVVRVLFGVLREANQGFQIKARETRALSLYPSLEFTSAVEEEAVQEWSAVHVNRGGVVIAAARQLEIVNVRANNLAVEHNRVYTDEDLVTERSAQCVDELLE